MDDMHHFLKIKYSHCDELMYNSGCALHEQDFETKTVMIPFGIFYPVRWMKSVFESNPTSVNGICDNVLDSNEKLKCTSYIQWMKQMVIDGHLDSTEILDLVRGESQNSEIDSKPILIEHVPLISRKLYEDSLNFSVECWTCQDATEAYCDIIYNTMLDLILKSVITFMLSMQRYGEIKIPVDVIIILGKILWNTRHEMIWIKLDPNQLKDNVDMEK